MPGTDSSSGDGQEFVFANVAPKFGEPVHLGAVYDAPAKQIRLYVDGQPAGTGVRQAGFDATGPLNVGRVRWNGAYQGYWRGFIDEVRLYSRVISEDELQGIVSRDSVPAGFWKLDGNGDDSSTRLLAKPATAAGAVDGPPARQARRISRTWRRGSTATARTSPPTTRSTRRAASRCPRGPSSTGSAGTRAFSRRTATASARSRSRPRLAASGRSRCSATTSTAAARCTTG